MKERPNFLFPQSFQEHMTTLDKIARHERVPIKVQKYLNLYSASLPLDSTARYYRGYDVEAASHRIAELANLGLETWVSFAPFGIINPLVSIQRKTPLIKEIHSPDDYKSKVIPKLVELPSGTWVKLFYDTHKDELKDTTSGAIRVTNGNCGFTDNREIVLGWGRTTDVRQIDKYAVWTLTDRVWRTMNGTGPKTSAEIIDEPEVVEIVRNLYGSFGINRKRMANLAEREGRTSICFEFKIRPHSKVPLFFVDYEYAGNNEGGSFSWFFYGYEGD